MNQIRNKHCTPRTVWFGLFFLMLTGFLIAGYAVQSGALAGPQEKKKEKKESDMDMMCPMMAGMKGVDLYGDSPALLLARAKALKLNEKQISQLKEIAESSRKKAREVLTAEQQKEIDKAPKGPLSIMQVTKLRMKEMMADKKMQHMCPMCMKMMQQKREKEDAKEKKEKE